jgi:hypothetical protein
MIGAAIGAEAAAVVRLRVRLTRGVPHDDFGCELARILQRLNGAFRVARRREGATLDDQELCRAGAIVVPAGLCSRARLGLGEAKL